MFGFTPKNQNLEQDGARFHIPSEYIIVSISTQPASMKVGTAFYHHIMTNNNKNCHHIMIQYM